MQVDKRVAFVVRKLNSAGYQAYLVGGCVRDFLLDNTPKDWDVATSAKPEAILACFVEDMHVIETGLKHGTVTIMSGGLPIEVTTFRTDGVYTDNRRPVAVTFVDELKKDLARRDFTMNALAYDLCENIDTGTHVNANNAKTVNPGSVRADYCTFDSDDVSVTGDICSTICRVDCDGCRDICGVAIRSVVGSDCSNINDGALRGVDVDSGAIRSVVSADCGNLGEASGIAEASVIAEASDNMVDCKIIDYFDGARDLKNCLIRAVGNPEMRLKEDALRILRALRFSAVLSFNIEDQLAKSIHNNKGLLCNISSERIAAEMSKMLIGDNILKVLLQYADVFAVFIPEIETSIGFEQRTPYHIYDVWEHTARSVAAVSMSSPTKDASQTIASSTSTTQSPIAVSSTSPTAISPPSPTTSPSTVPSSKPSPSPSSKLTTPTTSLSTPPTSSTANLYLRLTMLFHDLGKPRVFTMDEYGIGHFYQHNIDSEEIARKRLKALRFDNETIDVVTKLVRWHDTPISEKSLPRWLNRLGEENLRLLFEVKRADARAQNLLFSEARIATVDILEQQLNQLMENKQCFKLSDLEISGVDILQLGIKPGPAVGQVLNKLLEKVMDGEVANDRETLLVLAKKDIIYREHQYVDMI